MKYTGKAFKFLFADNAEELPVEISKGDPIYTSFWHALKYMDLKNKKSSPGSGVPFILFFEVNELDLVPIGISNYVFAAKKTVQIEGTWHLFKFDYVFGENTLWMMGQEFELDSIPVWAFDLLGPNFAKEIESKYELIFGATHEDLIDVGFIFENGRWMYEPTPDKMKYGEGMAILHHKTFTYRRALELFAQHGRKNPKEAESVKQWIQDL